MATSDEIKKLNDQIQQLSKELGKKSFKVFDNSELNEANAVLRGLRSELNEMTSDIGDIAAGFKNVVQEMQKSSVPLGDTKKSFRNLSKLAQDLKNDQEGIERLNQKQLKSLQDKVLKERSNLETTKKNLQAKYDENTATDAELAALNEITGTLEGNNALYEDLTNQVQARLDKELEVQDALGAGPKILGAIGTQLKKLGLPDFGLEKSLQETEDLLRDEEGRVDAQKAISTFSGKFKENLLKSFTPANMIAFAAKSLLEAVVGADKATAELAKSMNTSFDAANNLRSDLTNIAMLSGETFVNTKGLQDSLVSINQTLGTNVMLNEENLVTFTKLREQAGLTNEELMGIQSIANATGGDLENMTGEFLAQAKITATQNGAILNEKQLLSEVDKISAATTLSLGKNPKALAEASATAKAFGMEMSKVEAIAGSLLEFESSIESELEAELLLGKNINLEKARQAALNNDLATVAKEIADQAGSAAEFAEMNRIQQEALAKSVGMSREDLAQTLYVQEQIAGVSKEEAEKREKLLNQRIQEVGLTQAQNELAKDGFETIENQAGVADRLGAITDKIKDVFVAMSPAILAIGDALTLVFDIVSPIFSVIGFIGDLFSGIGEKISSLIGPLGVVGKILKGLASIAIVFAAYKAYASLASIPVFGVPLGIAAAAAVTSAGFGLLKAIKTGDMLSEAKGKTMVSPKEGGLFELSPNDDLVAAPGAAQAIRNASQNNNQTTNQVVMENKEAKETNELLRQILTKQGTVTMDSTEVGTAFAMSSYQVQ